MTGGGASEGYRVDVTEAGRSLGMFRFFADLDANRRFLEESLQELFWYAPGVSPKPGVAQVLATHPEAQDEAGRPLPLLAVGRYGAGRTLYSGMDSTWRWRYYTGEGAFNTFWVQSLRWLARGRKLGQRTYAFDADRPSYELGGRATLTLDVLDGGLLERLPDTLPVTLRDDDGTAIDRIELRRAQDDPATFAGGLDADRPGTFTAELAALPGEDPATVPITVEGPGGRIGRAAGRRGRAADARRGDRRQRRPAGRGQGAAAGAAAVGGAGGAGRRRAVALGRAAGAGAVRDSAHGRVGRPEVARTPLTITP